MSGSAVSGSTLSDPERILAAVAILVQQNPRATRRFAAFIGNPPLIGSVKLSWREGKFHACEVIEQTY